MRLRLDRHTGVHSAVLGGAKGDCVSPPLARAIGMFEPVLATLMARNVRGIVQGVCCRPRRAQALLDAVDKLEENTKADLADAPMQSVRGWLG